MRPAGTLVPGRSSTIAASSRSARPASSSRARPRSTRLACTSSALARRLLRVALHAPGDDLRQAGVLEVARRGARPPRGPFAGLLQLPLLALQLLLGVADVSSRRPARASLHGLLVHGEIAAVEQHFAAIQLGDAVHPVEQHAVVADQQQASRIVVQHVVEPVPRVEVEVVGRLVEQQDVGPLQQLRGQTRATRLRRRTERAQPSVEGDVAEAEPVQLGAGALLDVPVVADRGEVAPRRRRRPPTPRARRGPGRRPAPRPRCGPPTNGRRLRQVADGAVDGDRCPAWAGTRRRSA